MYSLQLVHLITKKNYKEWKSSVCQGFVTRIALLEKSMIPTSLKHVFCVEPLSGSDGKLPYFIKNGSSRFVMEIAN